MEQMRRFMADAAHELRTPVTILRTRTELALAQPRDATGDTAAFQAIEREADRLGGIVGDLLTLARADAGERQVVRASLYLDDVVSQVVAAARALAERKGVALVVGSFEEAQISGDAGLVERLVLIVLDNAIKYTPPGGRVVVEVGRQNGRASLRVQDSGPGIPSDELPRIWERLFRGDRSRAERGLGLGLSLVKAVVEAHAGQVSAVSSVGQGSTFIVSLPSA